MCGLCGALGQEDHWSVAKSAGPAERARMRRSRIALLNRILASRRLSIEDFQGGAYVLSTPTGRREVLQDLGMLWRIVEDMLGDPIDPLDPSLLERLAR